MAPKSYFPFAQRVCPIDVDVEKMFFYIFFFLIVRRTFFQLGDKTNRHEYQFNTKYKNLKISFAFLLLIQNPHMGHVKIYSEYPNEPILIFF